MIIAVKIAIKQLQINPQNLGTSTGFFGLINLQLLNLQLHSTCTCTCTTVMIIIIVILLSFLRCTVSDCFFKCY